MRLLFRIERIATLGTFACRRAETVLDNAINARLGAFLNTLFHDVVIHVAEGDALHAVNFHVGAQLIRKGDVAGVGAAEAFLNLGGRTRGSADLVVNLTENACKLSRIIGRLVVGSIHHLAVLILNLRAAAHRVDGIRRCRGVIAGNRVHVAVVVAGRCDCAIGVRILENANRVDDGAIATRRFSRLHRLGIADGGICDIGAKGA